MICQNCKKDYYSHNKKSKYCSPSCNIVVRNKLQAKPKKPKIMKKPKTDWELHWYSYFNGWVTIETMKSLMKDDYVTNYRPQIENSQKYGQHN